MSNCKSCGSELLWVKMLGTGKRMPLDALPSPFGTVHVEADGIAEVITDKKDREDRLQHNEPLYRSHFATCSAAAKHRKKK